MKSLFVCAGEHSGDLHGGALLEAIRRRDPTIELFGVGGSQMIASGLTSLLPMEQFQLFGYTDILWKFPQIWNQFRYIRHQILQKQPDALLFIDYPGFNLRLARSLRKKGYKGKMIYYISPTVWASDRGRTQLLADYLDLLLTIFPFESAYFAHTKLPVVFVGHPLVERIRSYRYDNDWYAKCGIVRPKKSIALFPGSRVGEVKRLFPRQLAAALALKRQDPDLAILVSCVDPALKAVLLKEIGHLQEIHLVPKCYTYELMRDCQTALAKSGTVTLELALHDKPTVVVYDLSPLNRLIARYILRLNLVHYCIVNILCGREIFPEYIEHSFGAEEIAAALAKLHFEGPARTHCLSGCREARDALATPHNLLVADHAARAILELML